MIDTLYLEDAVRDHPRAAEVIARFPEARVVPCARYGEVFNPKAQNFRLQKQKPALILAEKYRNFVLPAPPGYGIGAARNYYFSHMLNCVYDCRYCFLQGMYRSANYLLFVNYEDFQGEIRRIADEAAGEPVHFFSGYDCDSLALEPVTGFAAAFLPLFRELPNAWLELRTKSTQVRSLLAVEPLERAVVAFSFMPEPIAAAVDHKAPTPAKRLLAAQRLQRQGWPIGLRFDPVIYVDGWQDCYRAMFDEVFRVLDPAGIHSVSLGAFRLPDAFLRRMTDLYPDEKLFAGPLESRRGMSSYRPDLEEALLGFCRNEILRYVPAERFFPCVA
ncbi:DNA photolyase [Methylolobus aquaticus]|nr:DNA photolyase [Methylolobus aquaticus]